MMNSVSVQIQSAINDAISSEVSPQIQSAIMAGSGHVTKKDRTFHRVPRSEQIPKFPEMKRPEIIQKVSLS